MIHCFENRVTFGTDKGQTVVNNIGDNIENRNAVMQSGGEIIVSGVSSQSLGNNLYTNTYYLNRFNGYPVHVSLLVRIKRWLHNHTLTWESLPAGDNIVYYSVEQSSNSRVGFIPIAKVSGRSNLKDYSLTNSRLLQGTNYYRIKAVSTDGVVIYSEVVSADNAVNTARVFPNPAKNFVTVRGLSNNETAKINITDGNGNIKIRGISNGGNQYSSPLNNMLPGTYYVNITTGSKTEVVKFLKQ